eukprot:797969-Pyramimonas_sp.AAC.1
MAWLASVPLGVIKRVCTHAATTDSAHGAGATTEVPLLTCPDCGGKYRGPKGLDIHRKEAHNIDANPFQIP